MIELNDVRKSYGKLEVLAGVSMTIHTGNIIGLVGANGAGKTSLFRSIAGIESYEGKIQIAEECLPIGLLLSNPDYLTKMTAKEYLTFMCKARKIESFDVDAANIFELPLSSYASTFSTGMKKKLALTALLMQQNNFFILDEPFSGVDFESNLIINHVIKKIQEAGKTILISSHILSSLTDICDTIHFLNKGRIEQSVPQSDFSELQKTFEYQEFSPKIRDLKL
ncbi:MAG: ATP-binding cassette domain-containing protein [Flavobacteriales bacterium]|nr:ATP-binding cassette domain-containing protein [Flavobacteriales bacterium]